ncbi:MAG: HD domain-containing protein [Candidatus Aenigmarchaeota archaeon]|nr:HD domain-containing protein [Candidatus Aenigmarchaeota archaeon]
MSINVPAKGNKKLEEVLKRVNNSTGINTIWECCNVNSVKRMKMTDHGKTHFAIVSNIALKMLRLLTEKGIEPSIVKDHGMGKEDAEVVVFLASVLHDLGISVHRDNHYIFSVPLASQVLPELLKGIYDERERTIVASEVLNAIYSHEAGLRILTLEAGIVRVADALDMEEGRARIPFEQGKVDIYSISAMSISDVSISAGKEKPVVIQIKLHNEAGIFQVDELLKRKIAGTGLEKYISVVAEIGEKRVLKKYEME